MCYITTHLEMKERVHKAMLVPSNMQVSTHANNITYKVIFKLVRRMSELQFPLFKSQVIKVPISLTTIA